MYFLLSFSCLLTIGTTADNFAINNTSNNVTDEEPSSNSTKSSVLLPSQDCNCLNCSSLHQTQNSSFVVILLYKSSGHYLGMGGIIDKTTVITALEVVKPALGKPHEILVLAGYMSPWWGETSEIRKGRHMAVSNYDLVLVEVSPPWKYSDRITPIKISQYVLGYDILGVYGVEGSHVPGETVAKGKFYTFSLHKPLVENDCINQYGDLVPGSAKMQYVCLMSNGSFCTGSLGSPVVTARNSSAVENIIGVVIRSGCEVNSSGTVMITLSPFFDSWIPVHKTFH